MSTELAEKEVATALPWSREEVLATVEDYFSMLLDEFQGKPFNKSAHNEALRKKLSGRSKGAVELKHANISAVLDSCGWRYIEGYKPRGNYQALLGDIVQDYLDKHPAVAQALHRHSSDASVPSSPAPISLSCIDERAPSRKPSAATPVRTFEAKKWDLATSAEQDAANKALGTQGEQFVLQLEKLRLMSANRSDLAEKIRWVAKEDGDGAGYDILSWELSGEPRYIEVKTTNAGCSAAFYVTENERAFAESVGISFYLYRVYSFRSGPRVFWLRGPLSSTVTLEPIAYRARF